MSMVERWLEFDKHTQRKKFINQCVGLLVALVVLMVSSAAEPQRQPLALLPILGLGLVVLIQPRTRLSSLGSRFCSIAYMWLLALTLRAECHYIGTQGVFWLLPSADSMVLVSALFMIRELDYGIAVARIWSIFLYHAAELTQQTQLTYILINGLTVSGFGMLMNRSYVLGTLRLLKARDDFRLLAETDALTGLENRRSFMTHIEALMGAGLPAVLLLLDVDHFKRINDRWGHGVGDQALIRIAEALRSTRGLLAGARLGGEEFALILACPQRDSLADVLQHFAEHLIAYELPATLSGGAVWLAEQANSELALVAADVQLYAAKEAGRQQIFFNDGLLCRTWPSQALAS